MIVNSEIPPAQTTMIAVVTHSGRRTSDDTGGDVEVAIDMPGTATDMPESGAQPSEKDKLSCGQPEQLVPDILTETEDEGDIDVSDLEDLKSDGEVYLGSESNPWDGPLGPQAERNKFFGPKGGRIEEGNDIPSSDTDESYSSDEGEYLLKDEDVVQKRDVPETRDGGVRSLADMARDLVLSDNASDVDENNNGDVTGPSSQESGHDMASGTPNNASDITSEHTADDMPVASDEERPLAPQDGGGQQQDGAAGATSQSTSDIPTPGGQETLPIVNKGRRPDLESPRWSGERM
eukprot:GHVT01035145.1.p1 GENE.GHVT01035145.1~~GHVT01035145.1.p1  ORF type:complete len:292 (+),score=32.35 GHVT01035145.1:1-876(+)